MANLGKKGDLYVARFRYQGKEYKKSLKTTRQADAEAAMHGIERAIHGLATGLLQVPPGVDPGDFILSGGTLKEAARPRRRVPVAGGPDRRVPGRTRRTRPPRPSTPRASTCGTSRRSWATEADAPADRIAHRDLEQYLQARLKERTPEHRPQGADHDRPALQVGGRPRLPGRLPGGRPDADQGGGRPAPVPDDRRDRGHPGAGRAGRGRGRSTSGTACT